MPDTSQSDIFQIGIFGLLFFIIAYFVYSIIRQRNIFIKWQEARIKAEITTLENERKRIASDLHDDIGPMLSAIKLHVNHVEPASEAEKIIIEKSGLLMDEVIQRFREIAYNLLPNTLIRKGLTTAIEEFIYKMSQAHSLQIKFVYDEHINVPAEGELNLYRIVQEIVHNTIKHAQATTLSIQLRKKDGQLLFTSSDDGKGFSYNDKNTIPAAGLGLLNIQNRVTLLKGKLTIKSENSKGTKYIIFIPLGDEYPPANRH